jgi:phosphoribosylformylglycinamidine (FGAM) synthase PurS component
MSISFKELIRAITGFSTPVFGISWNAPEGERKKIRRLIVYLEDRRALSSDHTLRHDAVIGASGSSSIQHYIQSVLEIRQNISVTLQDLDENSKAVPHLRNMRAICRKLLSNPIIQHASEFQQQDYLPILGEFRGAFGYFLAQLCVMYGIDVEDTMAPLLPVSDSDDDFELVKAIGRQHLLPHFNRRGNLSQALVQAYLDTPDDAGKSGTKSKSNKPENAGGPPPLTGEKPTQGEVSVKDYIASINDAQTKSDALALLETMQRITGHAPKLHNAGTIGFDSYHYKYDSGREGDCYVLGFYPRKGKFTIYLMDGAARHSELLEKLGKHTTTRVCLYFKRLSDLQLPVLEQILQQSYAYIKSQDGNMGQVQEGWR